MRAPNRAFECNSSGWVTRRGCGENPFLRGEKVYGANYDLIFTKSKKCTGPTTILPHQKTNSTENGCIDKEETPKCVHRVGLLNATHLAAMRTVVVEKFHFCVVKKCTGPSRKSARGQLRFTPRWVTAPPKTQGTHMKKISKCAAENRLSIAYYTVSIKAQVVEKLPFLSKKSARGQLRFGHYQVTQKSARGQVGC